MGARPDVVQRPKFFRCLPRASVRAMPVLSKNSPWLEETFLAPPNGWSSEPGPRWDEQPPNEAGRGLPRHRRPMRGVGPCGEVPEDRAGFPRSYWWIGQAAGIGSACECRSKEEGTCGNPRCLGVLRTGATRRISGPLDHCNSKPSPCSLHHASHFSRSRPSSSPSSAPTYSLSSAKRFIP